MGIGKTLQRISKPKLQRVKIRMNLNIIKHVLIKNV